MSHSFQSCHVSTAESAFTKINTQELCYFCTMNSKIQTECWWSREQVTKSKWKIVNLGSVELHLKFWNANQRSRTTYYCFTNYFQSNLKSHDHIGAEKSDEKSCTKKSHLATKLLITYHSNATFPTMLRWKYEFRLHVGTTKPNNIIDQTTFNFTQTQQTFVHSFIPWTIQNHCFNR